MCVCVCVVAWLPLHVLGLLRCALGVLTVGPMAHWFSNNRCAKCMASFDPIEIESDGEGISLHVASAERGGQRDQTLVGTDAAPRPNNTFTRVALRGKRTQSAYDALCKAHTARAVARQRVKGKGVGKGKGRGKGKGVGKGKGRGKRKDTEADKGEDTGKGKGKARGKAKLLQRASRKKSIASERLVLPATITRRTETDKRWGEAYIMDGSNRYVVGCTGRASRFYDKAVTEVLGMICNGRLKSRQDCRRALRCSISNMGIASACV